MRWRCIRSSVRRLRNDKVGDFVQKKQAGHEVALSHHLSCCLLESHSTSSQLNKGELSREPAVPKELAACTTYKTLYTHEILLILMLALFFPPTCFCWFWSKTVFPTPCGGATRGHPRKAGRRTASSTMDSLPRQPSSKPSAEGGAPGTGTFFHCRIHPDFPQRVRALSGPRGG